MKYVLTVSSQASAHWQPLCSVLWLIGFLLPAGLALAFTLYFASRAGHIAQLTLFIVALIAALLVVGLTVVSVAAFARAVLIDAPRYLTDALPILVMGMTGLLVAPLLWLQEREMPASLEM
jgi:hypothetical protein